jgi:hypothetical protein
LAQEDFMNFFHVLVKAWDRRDHALVEVGQQSRSTGEETKNFSDAREVFRL